MPRARPVRTALTGPMARMVALPVSMREQGSALTTPGTTTPEVNIANSANSARQSDDDDSVRPATPARGSPPRRIVKNQGERDWRQAT